MAPLRKNTSSEVKELSAQLAANREDCRAYPDADLTKPNVCKRRKQLQRNYVSDAEVMAGTLESVTDFGRIKNGLIQVDEAAKATEPLTLCAVDQLPLVGHGPRVLTGDHAQLSPLV